MTRFNGIITIYFFVCLFISIPQAFERTQDKVQFLFYFIFFYSLIFHTFFFLFSFTQQCIKLPSFSPYFFHVSDPFFKCLLPFISKKVFFFFYIIIIERLSESEKIEFSIFHHRHWNLKCFFIFIRDYSKIVTIRRFKDSYDFWRNFHFFPFIHYIDYFVLEDFREGRRRRRKIS